MAMQKKNIEPAFLTITQVAGRLNLSRSSIYKLIDAGDLRIVKFGKSSRIATVALEDFIARAEGKAEAA